MDELGLFQGIEEGLIMPDKLTAKIIIKARSANARKPNVIHLKSQRKRKTAANSYDCQPHRQCTRK